MPAVQGFVFPSDKDGHVASTIMLITVLSVSVQSQSVEQTDSWMLWLYQLMKSETVSVGASPKQPLNSLPCEPKCPEILILHHYQRVSMPASCTCVHVITCVRMYVPGVSKPADEDTSTNRGSHQCPVVKTENCPSWIWVEAVAGLSVGSVLAASQRSGGVVLNL